MLEIDEKVKSEIEQATGRPVPEPHSAQFEAFFEELSRDHPSLARRLEDAITVTALYPEEQAQQAARRRAGLEALARRAFTKEVWGRQVLDRRAVSFAVFFLVFGVVAAGWTVTLWRGRMGQAVQSASVPVIAEKVQPVPVEMEVATEPVPALVAQVSSPPPSQGEEDGGSSLATRELPPYPGNVPPAPTDVYAPPDGYSADAPPAAMVASLPLSEIRAVDVPALAFTEVDVEPVGVSRELPLPPAPTSPASALAESIVGSVRELAPVVTAHGVDGGWKARAPITLVEPPADRRTASAFPPISTALTGSVETVIDPPRVGTETAAASAPTEASAAPEPKEGTQMTPEAGDAQSDLANRIAAPRDDDALRPGSLFPATLLRGVVVPEGQAGRVVADGTEGWCERAMCPALRWLGTATLAESGRLMVGFDRAYVDGRLVEVDAVAFGSDGTEGLAAALADITPALLADLLRASAGGVSDYVDAAAEAGTVVVERGMITTETALPSLLDFVLGRAASTVRVPEERTGVVRLAAVEAGVPLEVLLIE